MAYSARSPYAQARHARDAPTAGAGPAVKYASPHAASDTRPPPPGSCTAPGLTPSLRLLPRSDLPPHRRVCRHQRPASLSRSREHLPDCGSEQANVHVAVGPSGDRPVIDTGGPHARIPTAEPSSDGRSLSAQRRSSGDNGRQFGRGLAARSLAGTATDPGPALAVLVPPEPRQRQPGRPGGATTHGRAPAQRRSRPDPPRTTVDSLSRLGCRTSSTPSTASPWGAETM
jgi:hypothetical protein